MKQRIPHLASWIEILISSVIGLTASLVLSIEAITLAANPAAVLTCDISAKISCGAVGTSWQAHLLGFPNAFLGLMAEPVLITLAVASLARVAFPRWFMISAHIVSAIGFLFAWWLFFQAYLFIGALCPWCLLITVTTTLIFFALARMNSLNGVYGSRVQKFSEKALGVYKADFAVLAIVFALFVAAIIVRYL